MDSGESCPGNDRVALLVSFAAEFVFDRRKPATVRAFAISVGGCLSDITGSFPANAQTGCDIALRRYRDPGLLGRYGLLQR